LVAGRHALLRRDRNGHRPLHLRHSFLDVDFDPFRSPSHGGRAPAVAPSPAHEENVICAVVLSLEQRMQWPTFPLPLARRFPLPHLVAQLCALTRTSPCSPSSPSIPLRPLLGSHRQLFDQQAGSLAAHPLPPAWCPSLDPSSTATVPSSGLINTVRRRLSTLSSSREGSCPQVVRSEG
jgi:hypothetical protein